jgi:dihydrofolate reductase
MKLSIVVAMTRTGLIGREGKLPWHLPRDLKHFRLLTSGKPMILGRKTYESLGRPLPGRTNIILTRQKDYSAGGCLVAGTADEALGFAAATGADEAMIIGGSEVYREFLPRCEKIYLTLAEGSFEGDTSFPGDPLESAEWERVSEEHWPADDKNAVEAWFIVLSRKSDP